MDRQFVWDFVKSRSQILIDAIVVSIAAALLAPTRVWLLAFVVVGSGLVYLLLRRRLSGLIVTVAVGASALTLSAASAVFTLVTAQNLYVVPCRAISPACFFAREIEVLDQRITVAPIMFGMKLDWVEAAFAGSDRVTVLRSVPDTDGRWIASPEEDALAQMAAPVLANAERRFVMISVEEQRIVNFVPETPIVASYGVKRAVMTTNMGTPSASGRVGIFSTDGEDLSQEEHWRRAVFANQFLRASRRRPTLDMLKALYREAERTGSVDDQMRALAFDARWTPKLFDGGLFAGDAHARLTNAFKAWQALGDRGSDDRWGQIFRVNMMDALGSISLPPEGLGRNSDSLLVAQEPIYRGIFHSWGVQMPATDQSSSQIRRTLRTLSEGPAVVGFLAQDEDAWGDERASHRLSNLNPRQFLAEGEVWIAQRPERRAYRLRLLIDTVEDQLKQELSDLMQAASGGPDRMAAVLEPGDTDLMTAKLSGLRRMAQNRTEREYVDTRLAGVSLIKEFDAWITTVVGCQSCQPDMSGMKFLIGNDLAAHAFPANIIWSGFIDERVIELEMMLKATEILKQPHPRHLSRSYYNTASALIVVAGSARNVPPSVGQAACATLPQVSAQILESPDVELQIALHRSIALASETCGLNLSAMHLAFLERQKAPSADWFEPLRRQL